MKASSKMANKDSKGSKTRQYISANAPRRASKRVMIEVDAANSKLKDLMVEQCAGSGYLTVYRGSLEEFRTACVPFEAFPENEGRKVFQVQTLNVCSTGNRELLKGSMTKNGLTYEMEIDWGYVRPYVQGTHPALVELARMLLKDIYSWTNDGKMDSPLIRLADDPRAVDFKPDLSKRDYRLTPEFHKRLSECCSVVYETILTQGEIVISEKAAASKKSQNPRLRLVDTMRKRGEVAPELAH
jgi:hypothetical protein